MSVSQAFLVVKIDKRAEFHDITLPILNFKISQFLLIIRIRNRWENFLHTTVSHALLFAFGSEFGRLVSWYVIIQFPKFRMPMFFTQSIVFSHIVPFQFSVTHRERLFWMAKSVDFLPHFRIRFG